MIETILTYMIVAVMSFAAGCRVGYTDGYTDGINHHTLKKENRP